MIFEKFQEVSPKAVTNYFLTHYNYLIEIRDHELLAVVASLMYTMERMGVLMKISTRILFISYTFNHPDLIAESDAISHGLHYSAN